MRNLPNLARDATHVLLPDSDSPRGAGAAWIVPLRDPLTSGPCHPDERVHSRLRRRYWTGLLPGMRFTFPNWPRRGPIVLWTSAYPPDRLSELHAVSRLAAHEIWLVDVTDPKNRAVRVSNLDRELAAAAFSGVRRLNRRDVGSRVRRWRDFASGDLGAMSDDPVLRFWLQKMLPRPRRLSRFDESTLRCFSRWNTPVRALCSAPDLFFVMGDLWFFRRVDDWKSAGALVSRRVPGRPPHANREFQLTPLGKRWLERLDRPGEAPSLFIGGHEVYGPQPWINVRGRIVRSPR